MKKHFYILFFLQPFLLFQQTRVSYYKTFTTSIGNSAISDNTLTAKTYSFNYPVYRVLKDTVTNQLIISVRQKDPSGRLYTNRGYHLTVKDNDSIVGVYEDTKLDMSLMGDFLLISNDKRSGRFNRELVYEQFEYPSKIIYPIKRNNSGLTYNPLFKIGNEMGLSSINLKDGKLLWQAPVPSRYNWNSEVFLNDSTLLIAAGGLYAVNIDSGLVWSYSLTTAHKTNKPLTYSSFNHSTIEHMMRPMQTTKEEGMVTQIGSNILKSEGNIYCVAKDKMISVTNEGKLNWETDMSANPISNCLLYDEGENLLLINLGIAYYNENIVVYGKPYTALYNKQTGASVSEKPMEKLSNIADLMRVKNTWAVANRDHVLQMDEAMNITMSIELSEFKYGKFLEFVDGDEYYIEKEGFYVPLNFINDNVIYFKTDHGKVFGLYKSQIEYEYHYSELYKLNTSVNGKKLLSQKNKSLLISENMEPLHTFNSGEQAIVLGNKLYFTDNKLLHIINLSDLK